MDSYKTTYIHERSKPVPIAQHQACSNFRNTCQLNQAVFDPSKSSPPNDFLKKLSKRMVEYENSNRRYSSFSEKNIFILESA